MRPADEQDARRQINLDAVVASILGMLPTLDVGEQNLSLELYRLLAKGRPVPREALAERANVSIETVGRFLDRWPGAFSDPEQRVVSYWGLSIPTADSSPHRLTIAGRQLNAWCAWDTLFLPQLLGETVEIESVSPEGGAVVRLTVTPDRVERVDPPSAEMSFLVPDPADAREDVLGTFCHFVHFFPSRRTGESWVTSHVGAFMMSIDEAAHIARRKNEMQYPETLPRMLHARPAV
jgi:alkylmercury lyase